MIRLQLITLKGVRVDADVFELVVPTTAGTIAINGGHAPLLGAVAPGVLAVRHEKSEPDAEREQFGVYTGTVEVLNNTVRVLVDEVDTPHEIAEQEVEAAYKRAVEAKDKAGDPVSLAVAQDVLNKQAVRLKLAGIRKASKKRY